MKVDRSRRFLTEKLIASLDAALTQWQERNTPLPSNKCRTDACEGEVVKEVIGSFRGKMETNIPHCAECGQAYFNAPHARVVGREEFHDRMSQPMTV